MNEKAIIFGKQYVNKNVFHKNKKTINIATVKTKRRVSSKKDSYGKKRCI